MKNRILICIVLTTLALTVCGCGPSTSGESGEGSRQLKLAYVMVPGGPAHQAAEFFAQRVAEKTDGRLTVKLYPSGALGNDEELAELVMLGSIDMVVGGTAPIGQHLPAYGAIEAPFIFRDYEHLDKVLTGEIGDEIVEAFRAKGALVLGWWHRGPRYLTTTNRKVKTPSDLKGLKLRVPKLPVYREAWRILLGGNPTPVTYTEIFMALHNGIVEGQENPLEVIFTSSLYEVQRYAMETRHLYGVYMFMVNNGVYEGLSPEDREALREAVVEAGEREHELMLEYDQRFVEQLKGHGMEFVEVDRESFRRALADELPKIFEDVWAPDLHARIEAVR